MALPRARVRVDTGGGAVGRASDLLGIIGPSQSGTASARIFKNTQDELDTFGQSPGLQLAGHHVELNELEYLRIKCATGNAGSLGPVDTSRVVGTATWSFSGTPLDRERIRVVVVDGGVVGTAGVTIKVSRDGGHSYGSTVRLGTSTSYVIPGTGITVTWTIAGRTMLAGDDGRAECFPPRHDATGLAAAFDAVAASVHQPRLFVLCGEIDGTTCTLADVVSEINAYETTDGRYGRILIEGPERYPTAVMQKTRAYMGSPADVDFAASSDTITRDAGSFITEGFLVGQSVTVAGSVSNNGVKGVLTTVTALVLTLGASPGLTDEANLDGADLTITGVGPGDIDFAATGNTITRNIGSWITDGFKVGMQVYVDGSSSNDNGGAALGTITTMSATVLTLDGGTGDVVLEASVSALALNITGIEPLSTWRARYESVIGATPETATVAHRVVVAGGSGRRRSPISLDRRSRSAAWWTAIRMMGHQAHISPGKVADGPLEGVTIHDEDDELEEHDERVNGGLLSVRVTCMRTHDDESGVFVANALTLAEADTPLSRLQIGCVVDLACKVAKRETARRLLENVRVDRNGVPLEIEYKRIETYVLGQLRSALLSPTDEGPLASDVTFTMTRGINILQPGALVPCEVVVYPHGYLEQISTVVRVSAGRAA